MWLQRSATRSDLKEDTDHSILQAVTCGMSVLLFTHSLAMALAVVFRQHEHEHGVPTMAKLVHTLTKRRTAPRTVKVLSFLVCLYFFNWYLTPLGMFQDWHEELMIALLNMGAIGIFLQLHVTGKRGTSHRGEHIHSSWEASLIMVVGSLGSFCWWSELFGQDAQEELDGDKSFQRFCEENCMRLCAVTHFCMTSLFVDVFRGRIEPSVSQCIFLTFWSGVMLVVGAKLEHWSAIEHQQHHRHGFQVWEILEHLGEFGVCEMGLISMIAWLTHLSKNWDGWLDHGELSMSLSKPLLEDHRKSA